MRHLIGKVVKVTQSDSPLVAAPNVAGNFFWIFSELRNYQEIKSARISSNLYKCESEIYSDEMHLRLVRRCVDYLSLHRVVHTANSIIVSPYFHPVYLHSVLYLEGWKCRQGKLANPFFLFNLLVEDARAWNTTSRFKNDFFPTVFKLLNQSPLYNSFLEVPPCTLYSYLTSFIYSFIVCQYFCTTLNALQ